MSEGEDFAAPYGRRVIELHQIQEESFAGTETFTRSGEASAQYMDSMVSPHSRLQTPKGGTQQFRKPFLTIKVNSCSKRTDLKRRLAAD